MMQPKRFLCIERFLGCLVVFYLVFSPILLSADELNNLIHASESNITGKLIFRQMEGNLTLMTHDGVLAADIPTDVLFKYVSPWHTPESARITYNWDLGNGESVTGRDPVVHFNYKVPGNYTLRLRVGASGKHSRLSGRFTKDLQVLDAIRSIKLKGPASYGVDQNISLTLFVGGSSPKWICWWILPDCLSTHVTDCSLVELYENKFTLNHTFSSEGTYCLEISAHNDISMLQTSYSIHVQSGPSSHLLFILPCASVILAILMLITVSVCCPRQLSLKKKAEVSLNVSTYTTLEMKTKEWAVCSHPESQENEDLPLICDPGQHYSS